MWTPQLFQPNHFLVSAAAMGERLLGLFPVVPVGICRYEVGDLWHPMHLKVMNFILDQTVRIGDTLMLT
jgi:hypothetical protein